MGTESSVPGSMAWPRRPGSPPVTGTVAVEDDADHATVRFPDSEVAVGFGCDAGTVRSDGDLEGVRKWLDGWRARPMVDDVEVRADEASWWLVEAFRGH